MSEHSDGGPAFPQNGVNNEAGMSLRDYFAAKALPSALIVCQHDAREAGTSYTEYCAGMAYTVADAMLRARSGT